MFLLFQNVGLMMLLPSYRNSYNKVLWNSNFVMPHKQKSKLISLELEKISCYVLYQVFHYSPTLVI